MSKTVSKKKAAKSLKSKARTEVIQKLSEVFRDYKTADVDKKWNKKLKKASKVLAPILITSKAK
jgi:hypothetical protein